MGGGGGGGGRGRWGDAPCMPPGAQPFSLAAAGRVRPPPTCPHTDACARARPSAPHAAGAQRAVPAAAGRNLGGAADRPAGPQPVWAAGGGADPGQREARGRQGGGRIAYTHGWARAPKPPSTADGRPVARVADSPPTGVQRDRLFERAGGARAAGAPAGRPVVVAGPRPLAVFLRAVRMAAPHAMTVSPGARCCLMAMHTAHMVHMFTS